MIPDSPDIRNAERYGYPRKVEYPHCPVCGAECETVYRDEEGDIIGCDCCLESCDAWEAHECFKEDE